MSKPLTRRTLETCEKRGTTIVNKDVKTWATIVGSYVGGFIVQPVGTSNEFKLPFERVGLWEVVE